MIRRENVDTAPVYIPRDVSSGCASLGKEEEEAVCGFIFMCNARTKAECYRYRVFGLPAARAEVIGKIAPGTLLFLFDFESKLLYGVYAATTPGKMNLQPCAFGGRFPAQVSFKIHKDCLPLPERSFRSAILENYSKGKFKQELNGQQVQNLLLLFRPFTMPSLMHTHPTVVNAATPLSLLLTKSDNPLQPKAQLPSTVQVQPTDSIQLNPCSIAFGPQLNSHNELGSQHTGSLVDLALAYQQVGQHSLPDRRLSLLGGSPASSWRFNHAPTVLHTESAPQRSLSSQFTSSGVVTSGMSQYHVPVEQQTFTSMPTYSALVHQPYVPQEPAASLADRQYIVVGQEAQGNQHVGVSDSYYYQVFSQSRTDDVPQQENSSQYYYHPNSSTPAITHDPTYQHLSAEASRNTGHASAVYPVSTSSS